MVPIRSAAALETEELMRLLQANFDSALDARYAVARGKIWGVFIHPLQALQQEELISGIGQTIDVAKTYGGLYSSGGMQFGRGDGGSPQRELIERLFKKGKEI